MSLVASIIMCDFSSEDRRRVQTITLSVVGLALLCSMDLWQLVFAAMGAACYTMFQALSAASWQTTRKAPRRLPPMSRGGSAPQCSATNERSRPKCPIATRPGSVPPPPSPTKQPSQQPVLAPVFNAVGFDGEVTELLGNMALTAKSERLVREIAESVERLVRPVLPEASVVGFVNVDLACGAVDIVVCADAQALASISKSGDMPRVRDPSRLAKSALRLCTDRLIVSGGFRFRRSAFRNDEPKVTLLASAVEAEGEAVPIEVSVNSATPGFNAALLMEIGRIDPPTAKGLALLVRRWAKDRGACHAAKGHLQPYAWTLLAVYFLQVGCEEGPLLPPVSELSISVLAGAPPPQKPPFVGRHSKTVGQLFRAFIHFYARTFDFDEEVVSAWTGARVPRQGTHARLGEAGPQIEDPFDTARDLGRALSDGALAHLREEFARADALLSAGASLSELLTPWSPPEPERDSSTSEQGSAEEPAV
mmetsp:Transcript_6881/g.19517  ORF Transcript_6881/g.19517 Transcript_6881/m.19517 type:complete len:479 (-) Transcript_6881:101-1537(-)